jgi:hypothetical protein
MTISSKIHTFHTNAGDLEVPCVVIQGYDVNGDETDVEGNTTEALVLLLGYDSSKRRVDKGTTAGTFQFSA